jgi:hypothetical protein
MGGGISMPCSAAIFAMLRPASARSSKGVAPHRRPPATYPPSRLCSGPDSCGSAQPETIRLRTSSSSTWTARGLVAHQALARVLLPAPVGPANMTIRAPPRAPCYEKYGLARERTAQMRKEVEHNRLDARSARVARSDGDGAARRGRVARGAALVTALFR